MTIDPRTNLHIISLTSIVSLALVVLVACVAHAQDRVSEARKQLADRGIAFTPESFLRAARNGDETVTVLFLEGEMQINVPDREANSLGYTALHWAAREGHLQTVQLLVEHGAELRANDDRTGGTALHLALAAHREKVARYLIPKYAAIDAIDTGNFGGATPLSIAAREGLVEMARLLIEKGADIEGRGNSHRGLTPLGMAVVQGRTAVAEELIGRGANYEDVGGKESALILAARYRNVALAKLLIERGANMGAHDAGGWAALHWAARNGMTEVVRQLLDHAANVDGGSPRGVDSPLIAAIFWGHVEVVNLLIDRGANVNRAGLHGARPLSTAIVGGNVAIVRLLIAKGADINAGGIDGRTPLIEAAQRGLTGLVKLLIDKGADVHARDENAQTALDYAVAQKQGAVIEMLRSAGAS